MRLEDLPVETMREALRIYLEVAWEEEAGKHWPPIDWDACGSASDVIACFKDETGSRNMRKYSLRLGNARYPFMKVVFQELLLHDSFFFAVDTHDDLSIKDAYQDYEKWLEIKRYNTRVKEEIERTWTAAGVPTFATMVAEVERSTPMTCDGEARGPLILIVDDDPALALGVETILNRSGYTTCKASSGEEALEVLEERRPALVLSDLEMRGMTGLELAGRLRKDPRMRSLPFILATAASISAENFGVIDGFLVKPFDTQLLLRFIEQHIGTEKPG